MGRLWAHLGATLADLGQKPRNPETQKLRNPETQKPQEPRNPETQKPRNPETQKPGKGKTVSLICTGSLIKKKSIPA